MPTIALVDDDLNIVVSASSALEAEGYLINIYPDGASALVGFKTAPPDLVILDVMMPDSDGIETLHRLRQKNSHLPVIVLTARGQKVDELSGLEQDADDLIRKPFSQGQLVERVRAVLRRVADRPPAATKGYAHAQPVAELLGRFNKRHDSVSDLSHSLVCDVDDIFRNTCRSIGLDISDWRSPDVLCEPRFDQARSQLSNLMTRVRDNLIATIAKNNKVENAVVLLDWQAAELLLFLARKALQSEQRFGDFERTETFTQEEAEQLARLEVHKPLSVRQSVAERRAALRAFADEADDVSWKALEQAEQGKASSGRTSAAGVD
jgi:DNA-binding response OmpR family regulator